MAQTKVQMLPKSEMLDRVLNKKIGVDIVYIFPEQQEVEIPDRPDVWVFNFKMNNMNHNQVQVANLASRLCQITRSTLFYVEYGGNYSGIVSDLLKINFAIPIDGNPSVKKYTPFFFKYKKQVEDSVGYTNIIKNGRKLRYIVDIVVENGLRVMFVTAGKKSEIMEVTSKHAYDLSLTTAQLDLINLLDFVPLSEADGYILQKIENNKKQKHYEERYRKRNAKTGI